MKYKQGISGLLDLKITSPGPKTYSFTFIDNFSKSSLLLKFLLYLMHKKLHYTIELILNSLLIKPSII